MIQQTLGQKLHELRTNADLSLRELAKKLNVSAPFLSDIELGRRFPSEEVLTRLADALKIGLEEIKKYDTRQPIAELKRLVDADPKMGFAFRTAVEKVREGKLTPEEILERLNKPKARR